MMNETSTSEASKAVDTPRNDAPADLDAEELNQLRADARRYRWLRSGRQLRQGQDTGVGLRQISRDPLRALMTFAYWCSPVELDAAIDSASTEMGGSDPDPDFCSKLQQKRSA